MSLRKPNPREQAMLFLLVLVALVTGYMVFHYQKKTKTLDQLRSRTEMAEAAMEGLSASKESAPDLRPIEARLQDLWGKKKKLIEKIATLGGEPFACVEAKQVEDLNLDISSLAKLCGVDLIENIPLTEQDLIRIQTSDKQRAVLAMERSFPSLVMDQDPWRLPLRKITMLTSYNGFRAFIAGFSRLSSRIVIMNFKATRYFQDPAQPLASGLRIELTWVIV